MTDRTLQVSSETDRAGQRLAHALAYALRRAWARISGKSSGNQGLHQQPIVSDTVRLYRWTRQPAGSRNKPASIDQIPWDYVETNRDRIPFNGLKEYWYPLALTKEVNDFEPRAFTICGEEIVAYRTPEGEALAFSNRCPHRNVLLSTGQLNVVEPGTLTCRYHGLTIDRRGKCIAVLADGPDSPACGKVKVRQYPLDEVGGIVWIYMGKKTPRNVLDDVPYAREVLARAPWVTRVEIPTSHLNVLDNQFDLAHPSVLHRTCAPFSSQTLWGRLQVEPRGDYGFHLSYGQGGPPHPGAFYIKEIEWMLPNTAYFPPGSLSGKAFRGSHGGYHWPVPHNIDNCTAWFMFTQPERANSVLNYILPGRKLLIPGGFKACVEGTDIAMMIASGKIARWEEEALFHTDKGVVRARDLLRRKHREELGLAEHKNSVEN